MGFNEAVGEYVPYKDQLAQNLRYAGYEDFPILSISGFLFSYSIVLGFVGFEIATLFLGYGLLLSLIIWALLAGLIQFTVYMFIVFKGDKRGQKVDSILPDALQLMSANVRAGMTVDRAIWLAARPEFGPLEEEIKRTSTEVLGASTIPEALSGMTRRIKSRSLERAVKLINEGLEGGGEIATLLDQIAIDIRSFQTMEEEARSNTTTYTTFILMASVLGAPILFGISSYFIDITNQIFAEKVSAPAASRAGSTPISLTGPAIDPQMVHNFMIAALVVITVFGSLIVGLIRTGEEKNGLKYMPFIIGGSLAVFFLTRSLVASVFGSILVL